MIKRMSGVGGANLLMGFSVVFQVTLSVLIIAAGVLIAALGDFSFDPFGYSLAFISVFFQVLPCFYHLVLFVAFIFSLIEIKS